MPDPLWAKFLLYGLRTGGYHSPPILRVGGFEGHGHGHGWSYSTPPILDVSVVPILVTWSVPYSDLKMMLDGLSRTGADLRLKVKESDPPKTDQVLLATSKHMHVDPCSHSLPLYLTKTLSRYEIKHSS